MSKCIFKDSEGQNLPISSDVLGCWGVHLAPDGQMLMSIPRQFKTPDGQKYMSEGCLTASLYSLLEEYIASGDILSEPHEMRLIAERLISYGEKIIAQAAKGS